MINLTESAARKIQELYTANPQTGKEQYLRVYVQEGGCEGYEYGFAFDIKKADDSEIAVDGVKLIVDQASAGFLADSTIDYVEDVASAVFRIDNPNVKSSCGCGHSHSF